jgi:hypothetical protein
MSSAGEWKMATAWMPAATTSSWRRAGAEVEVADRASCVAAELQVDQALRVGDPDGFGADRGQYSRRDRVTR